MKGNNRKRKTRRLLSVMTAAALCLISVSIPFGTKESKAESTTEKSASELSNPTTDSEGVTTWDCIYFGNYWQNDTNGDGTADQNDTKEPIKWRVLSVDGDETFLLADQNLDCQPYNEEGEDVTWETCTLRTWLNGTFLTNAFSEEEQAVIQSTTVVNDDNPKYGTEGGNNTTDQVYLLSIAEASNTAYGFHGTFNDETETREAKNTAYATACGAYTSPYTNCEGNGCWWLRSPGDDSDGAADVIDDGRGNDYGYGVYYSLDAVRPALHVNLSRLNLSSSTLWSYAGKVTSDGDSGASQTTSPTPTKEPSAEPEKTKAPTPTSTYIPSTSGLENPIIDSDGVTTWDCVWFGNYWQNDTNGDGKADKNDDKEPIKWRVLSVNGNDAFLLADQNLDAQPYNEEDIWDGLPWKDCALRSWLKDTFLSTAFHSVEQEAIKNTTVVQDDPYDTKQDEATLDKVYILSMTEASNMAYGFDETFHEDSATRTAKNTAYVEGLDVRTYNGNGCWWLRTPMQEDDPSAHYVEENGFGNSEGADFDASVIAVRPVLHLDLSSSVWSPAGTVRSDGTEVSIPPTGASVPTLTPSTVPTASAPAPSVAPTGQSQASVTPTVTPVSTLAPTITPPATADTTPSVPSVQLKSLKALKKGKAKAEWKKVTKIDGYRLQYAQDKKFKKKTKTKWLAAKKKSVTLTGLKKKKTYYVRIAAYVLSDGKKVYGKWSNIKKVKIKK